MKVRLEPIGVEIECGADETVLDAAFRQGLNLVYGCREGQCSACKCFLLEGEVALKRYSNFALSDTEQASGYTLMCRAMPEQDLVVELLHYDPENFELEHAIHDGEASVEAVEPLTHDITRLVLKAPGFTFTPGQYVDLHVPDSGNAKRSFSMANLPGDDRIELMIKRYPGGRLSGMLEDRIQPGDTLGYTGPYGSLRVHDSEAPILMIAGGSGMAPVLSLLRHLAQTGCMRPIRFFYGARTEQDLFHTEHIEGLDLSDFQFIPVTGRFVHEAVDEYLTEVARSETSNAPEAHVYMCGPPPMIEAAEDMLAAHGVSDDRIFIDKFTTSASAVPADAPDAASERDFTWFTPEGRRATLYEDVTVDTQPSIHRHLTRGWLLSFEDGRGTWEDASTALTSPDWFAFRDPGRQWERTFYQAGNAAEQQIEGAVRAAASEGLLQDFSADWIAFLKHYLQVPAYVEHGLWFATATIARDCLSDTVAHCVCLQAAMKQRSAQALVLLAMDLEDVHGDFSIEASRRAFLEEPAWQPTRRYLEKLAATRDWGEVIVAANLCFEPVIGTLLRREIGIRVAAAHGDTLTPTLARVATQEWEWVRSWSTALARFLLPANRTLIDGWVADWRPAAMEAAESLVAVLPFALDLNRVRAYADEVLSEAGLAGADCTVSAPAPTRRVRPETARQPRAGTPVVPRQAPPAMNGSEGTYDYVGIVMAKSAEGDAVAAILGRRADVEVIEQPAFWDIRAKDRLVIAYEEVSEQLGYEIGAYSIQHEMSTHYGRMVATDDALMLFSDPSEAMQYLMA
jgi:ferredoxin-NADP reductase/ferredoxin